MGMKLSNFSFDLPGDLLAEYPSPIRDEARLMVLDRETKKIEHKMFKDLIDYFKEDDVLVGSVLEDFSNEIIDLIHALKEEKESFADLVIEIPLHGVRTSKNFRIGIKAGLGTVTH